MDYQGVISLVRQKLGNRYLNVIEDLKECVASGSTGGEIASMVGYYLIHLETKEPEAYAILKGDIQQYLLSCRKSGLYFDS